MKIIKYIFVLYLFFFSNFFLVFADSFDEWKINFKNHAINEGVSKKTLNELIDNARFLSNVIKYDRYQPEFYEDTKTYISKRASNKKLFNGKKLYRNNVVIIDKISTKYSIDKSLLLALMGIETNFGTYLGKMDIISSLATLSYDKRRSEFFTEELLILLKLIDLKIIDPLTLYGSWAGAFGNFQFMPRTIKIMLSIITQTH